MNARNLSQTDELRKKREEWLEWTSGKDFNSICNQLQRLAKNQLLFTLFEEAVDRDTRWTDGSLGVNAEFAYFVRDSFFDSQASGVRRLLDRGKDVVSLVRLVRELTANAYLLTRHNLLTVLVSDDYGRLENEHMRRATVDNKAQTVSGSSGWGLARRVHLQMDELCGVAPKARRPDDTVPARIFCALCDHLKEADDSITKTVNKFVAHAAEKKSRKKLSTDQTKLTLESIEVAMKSFCEIASFVKKGILWGDGGPLFPASWDPCDTERPSLAAKAGVACLRTLSADYKQRIEGWCNGKRPDWLCCSPAEPVATAGQQITVRSPGTRVP